MMSLVRFRFPRIILTAQYYKAKASKAEKVPPSQIRESVSSHLGLRALEASDLEA